MLSLNDKKRLLSQYGPWAVVTPILTALGRRTTVYPGYLSQLLHYGLSTLPRFARTFVMGKVMKGMAG